MLRIVLGSRINEKERGGGRTNEERNSSVVSRFCSRRDFGRTKLNPSIYARNFYHHRIDCAALGGSSQGYLGNNHNSLAIVSQIIKFLHRVRSVPDRRGVAPRSALASSPLCAVLPASLPIPRKTIFCPYLDRMRLRPQVRKHYEVLANTILVPEIIAPRPNLIVYQFCTV